MDILISRDRDPGYRAKACGAVQHPSADLPPPRPLAWGWTDGSMTMSGEVDAGNLEFFHSALEELTAATRPDATIDIGCLEFMDGAAIRSLLTVAAKMANRGGALTLRNPRYIVRRALSVLTPEEILDSIRIVP